MRRLHRRSVTFAQFGYWPSKPVHLKQCAGLEDWQACFKKRHTLFNVSLTAISFAKCTYSLPLPEEQRGGFSMADVKILRDLFCFIGMNTLIAERIFDNLYVNLNDRRTKQLYADYMSFGRLRAYKLPKHCINIC